MIKHHPADDLLTAFAAGRGMGGVPLLLAVHLEACAACRARLHTLQAAGGAMLAVEEPQVLAPDAFARTLERIDAAPPSPPARRQPAQDWPSPTLPDGSPWPRALRGCAISRWRWMGPGMRFARVRLPHDPLASVYLLKIAPGRKLARHTHTGTELTQVLCGAFDDGRHTFAAGDFDAADAEVLHQPAVAPGQECVCLAAVEGRLKFDGRIGAAIGGLIGM